MSKYVIFSLDETNRQDDDEPMFWNNDDGYGSLSTATIFTEIERQSVRLPLFDAIWVEFPEL